MNINTDTMARSKRFLDAETSPAHGRHYRRREVYTGDVYL